MEDVLIKMPTADVTLLTQMASRMGWAIERRRDAIARFLDACSVNQSDSLTDEEIQAEVNAVRYGR